MAFQDTMSGVQRRPMHAAPSCSPEPGDTVLTVATSRGHVKTNRTLELCPQHIMVVVGHAVRRTFHCPSVQTMLHDRVLAYTLQRGRAGPCLNFVSIGSTRRLVSQTQPSFSKGHASDLLLQSVSVLLLVSGCLNCLNCLLELLWNGFGC